ncbi:Protein of unknown function, partial [Gryllus bimaculatus]
GWSSVCAGRARRGVAWRGVALGVAVRDARVARSARHGGDRPGQSGRGQRGGHRPRSRPRRRAARPRPRHRLRPPAAPHRRRHHRLRRHAVRRQVSSLRHTQRAGPSSR